MKKSMVKKNAGELLVDEIRCGMVRKNINIKTLCKQSRISQTTMYKRMHSPGQISLAELPAILRAAGIEEITIRATDVYLVRRYG